MRGSSIAFAALGASALMAAKAMERASVAMLPTTAIRAGQRSVLNLYPLGRNRGSGAGYQRAVNREMAEDAARHRLYAKWGR